jgi:putative ABC transport system permease protein
MLLGEILRVAIASIQSNKLRSFLTALGIIIGIAAVITMVALGEGAQRAVKERLQQMGTNVLTVRPGQEFSGGIDRGEAELAPDDAEALLRQAGAVTDVAPEMAERRLQVEFAGANANAAVVGTWPSFFPINNHTVAAGRLFTSAEERGRRRVAVLGASVGELLGMPVTSSLIGQTLTIREIPFQVVGVLAAKGEQGWVSPDETIYLPLATAQFRVFGTQRLRSILVKAESEQQMDAAIAEIDRILRREHRLRPGEASDFNIRNQATLLNTFQETTRTFSFLLAGIALISLLVGGIGIMNIMLVSVTERTREIGIRKALGARRRDILLQFLIEALVLCLTGGALGVATGLGGIYALQRLARWNAAIAPEAVLLAFACAATVGLFFGIWPARRAARLDPIVALRYE